MSHPTQATTTRQALDAGNPELWSTAVCAMVFALDLLIPLGFAAGVPYIAAVWLAAFSRRNAFIWQIATACTVLTVFGLWLSPGVGTESTFIVVNRALAIILIWLAAIASHWHAQTVSALARSQELYRLAVPNVGLWDWDVTTGEVDWSQRLRKMLGITDVRYKPRFEDFKDRLHREDKDLATGAIEAHLSRAEPYEVEYRLRRNDDTYIWVHARGQAVWDENGKPLRMVGAAEDISGRKKADLLAKLAVEAAPSGMLMVDDQGHMVMINTQLEKIFGYSRDELLGKPVEMLVPSDIRESHPTLLRGFFENPSKRLLGPEGNLTGQRRDGSHVPIEINLTPVLTESNTYALAAVIDISERKLTEELTRSNKELDNFAYIASHDLKAPLRAIKNLAEWVLEDDVQQLSEQSNRYLGQLRQRAARMNGLLDGLLAYSRIGRVAYETKPIDTGKLVENVVGLIASGDRFEIKIAADMPIIEAVETPLEAVFRNLLDNAIKHHHAEGGHISIGHQMLGDAVEFFVRDDGPGIEPQFQERIFRIFQTLRRKDEVEGSGVGLALVKKTVESYGGAVRVQSAKAQGTTFYFTWPITAPIQNVRAM